MSERRRPAVVTRFGVPKCLTSWRARPESITGELRIRARLPQCVRGHQLVPFGLGLDAAGTVERLGSGVRRTRPKKTWGFQADHVSGKQSFEMKGG